MALDDTLTPDSKPKDSWSTSNKLITTDKMKAVSLQADFPVGDVYTVQLAIDPPKSGVYRAIALVTWTVEGNQISRQIDAGNGASISAPSKAVRVAVNDITTNPVGGTAGEPYGVTIAITRGTRAFGGRPPTLKASDASGNFGIHDLAPGGNVRYPIPLGAGVTSVEVAAFPTAGGMIVAGPTPDVSILHANTSVALKGYKYADPGAGTDFVSVSPLATEIVITNFELVHNVNVSVTWGIDG